MLHSFCVVPAECNVRIMSLFSVARRDWDIQGQSSEQKYKCNIPICADALGVYVFHKPDVLRPLFITKTVCLQYQAIPNSLRQAVHSSLRRGALVSCSEVDQSKHSGLYVCFQTRKSSRDMVTKQTQKKILALRMSQHISEVTLGRFGEGWECFCSSQSICSFLPLGKCCTFNLN